MRCLRAGCGCPLIGDEIVPSLTGKVTIMSYTDLIGEVEATAGSLGEAWCGLAHNCDLFVLGDDKMLVTQGDL